MSSGLGIGVLIVVAFVAAGLVVSRPAESRGDHVATVPQADSTTGVSLDHVPIAGRDSRGRYLRVGPEQANGVWLEFLERSRP